MRTTVLALGVSFLACSSNNNTTPDAPKPVDASPDAPGSGSGGSDSFTITGQANGLFWDNSTSTLYFTEKTGTTGNAFAKWTDAGGVQTVASLDGVGSANPGDIIKLADGSFLTPQFSSSNTNNGIIHIVGSDATLLQDAARGTYKQVGMALDGSGNVFTAAFVGKTGSASGFVLEDTITGTTLTETPMAGSGGQAGMMMKVVGIASESDGSLLISDADSGAIWKLDATFNLTSFATITKPDLLIELPNGDVLTGTGGGPTLRRVSYPGGVVTNVTLPSNITTIYGTAFDKTNHRLFVDGGGTGNDVIYIVPYMPN